MKARLLPLVVLLPWTCLAAPLPPGIHDGRDLAALDPFIEDAKVIGLGESFHGSDGFLSLRFRIMKHLVREKGVRAITLETPWGPALTATRYVATCQGSALQATRSLIFGWQAKETVSFLRWLCEFNRGRPESDRVKFFGHEVMYQPWYDSRALRTYLTRAAPSAAGRLMAGISACSGVANPAASADDYYVSPEFHAVANGIPFVTGVPLIDEGSQRRCRRGLAELTDFLEANWRRLMRSSSARELEWAKLSAESLGYNQDMYYYVGRDIVLHSEARDGGAAHVFQRLHALEFPDAPRIVTWAHNGHLVARGEEVGALNNPWVGGKVMGSYLREAYGDAYAPIGAISYRTSLKWPSAAPGKFRVAFATATYDNVLPGPGTVEHLLAGLGQELLLVDPRSSFFEERRPTWFGGYELVPADQFKAFFFMQRSPAMDFWWE
jgi:hypothetical protein